MNMENEQLESTYNYYRVPDLIKPDYHLLAREMLDLMHSNRNVYVPEVLIKDFYQMGNFFEWVNFSYILNRVPEVEVSNEKVSVCILTYNNEKYISQCIKAITEFADEIMIVDSKSTDGTKQIIEELADVVVYVENSIGFDKKRNIGIQAAHGDGILMVDIFWLPRYWVKAFHIEPMYYYTGDLCLWPNPQARLFRKKSNCIYRGKLHEEIYSETARKACMISNESCTLYHFKYWFYDNAYLEKLVQDRGALISKNKDDMQLLPWKYQKECKEVTISSLDSEIKDLLTQLCKE